MFFKVRDNIFPFCYRYIQYTLYYILYVYIYCLNKHCLHAFDFIKHWCCVTVKLLVYETITICIANNEIFACCRQDNIFPLLSCIDKQFANYCNLLFEKDVIFKFLHCYFLFVYRKRSWASGRKDSLLSWCNVATLCWISL